jgi:hypothetical protein
MGQKGQELERAMIGPATRHSHARAATMAAPSSLVPVVPSAAALALVLRLPPVAKVTELWRRLARDLFDPYQPERHYMRGPGPKWREKHGAGRA